jgi:hypothetical protein
MRLRVSKMTATNIDHIKANEPLKACMVPECSYSGKAARGVHDLFSEDEIVSIETKVFLRWN